MDAKNDLKIVVIVFILETNFNGFNIANEIELLEFANRAKFPSHELLIKPFENNYSKVVKGILKWDALKMNFEEFKKEFGSVYIETDIRANFNLSRMKVIAYATKKLLDAVLSKCPKCEVSGFVVTDVLAGLRCSWCNCATQSTLSFVYICKKCEFTEEVFYPHEKTKEDPAYCGYRNT